MFGGNVFATDFDKAVIGTDFGGVIVEDGHAMTLNRVSESDLVLMTGMTICTNSFDEIMRKINSNKAIAIMYCETGSNFANELISLGIHSVVAEEYPFYMFPGMTHISVYHSI